MDCAILPAVAEDAPAIAALHAESWRTAYRGMVPDDFLDGPINEERLQFWTRRMVALDPVHSSVVKAVSESHLAGFACIILDVDPIWGALLDNLHVRPDLKGRGIGGRLFDHVLEWARAVRPGRPLHLWVLDKNAPARRFYERRGGRIADSKTLDVVPGVPVVDVRYVWD